MNLGQDQIARSCSISQATVHRYLERADSAGLTWPLPEDHDDRRLNELLFPTRPDYPPSVPRPGLDFAEVHRQLQANRFVTLQLLWEEYREKQSGGLRLQPLLRTLPALEPESKRHPPAGSQSGRETVRRLGRPHGPHLRQPNRRD